MMVPGPIIRAQSPTGHVYVRVQMHFYFPLSQPGREAGAQQGGLFQFQPWQPGSGMIWMMEADGKSCAAPRRP